MTVLFPFPVIHRDIKPSNVMIPRYDGRPVPKVIDFGVAKATQHPLAEQSIDRQHTAGPQADAGHVLQSSRTRRQRIELIRGDSVVELIGAANSLATCADVTLRDPARAAELATQADTILKRVENEQHLADIRIWLGHQLWHLSDVWVRLDDLPEAESPLR